MREYELIELYCAVCHHYDNANQESNPKTAQATLANTKANKPDAERTFDALWMLVFSISQLLKDSIACLMLDTARE